MKRARFGAFGLAVAAAGTLAVTVALVPAQATTPTAGQVVAVTPVTSSNGDATLVVDPTTDLPVSGATVTAKGTGYPSDIQLYVAICPSGERAPANLTGCIGGPANGDPTSGPWVVAETDDKGGFTATLSLPSDASASAACVPDKCSLYTVKTDGQTGADMKVPVAFKSPPTSSSAPPTPSSAIVQQVGSATIAPGATQQVIFSGFKGGEQVNLTLFSEPVTLSPVTADPTGVARVDFVVPADFVDGTHRLQAVGAESGTVGVASFQVVVPTPTPTPTPTPSPTPSPTPTPTPSSVSSSASSSAAPTTAVTTTSAAAGGDSGSSNWWIWLILALIVLAGLITWFIVYRRNKEAARAEQEQQLASAASREQAYDPNADAPTMVLPPTNPPAGGPPPGADPYGLLSGRNHPYGVDPNAPTQYNPPPPGPTQIIPPGSRGPGAPGGPGSGGTNPPTRPNPQPGGPRQPGGPQAWNVPPEFAGGAPAGGAGQPPAGPAGPTGPTEGPRTQQFRPDFDDEDGDPGTPPRR